MIPPHPPSPLHVIVLLRVGCLYNYTMQCTCMVHLREGYQDTVPPSLPSLGLPYIASQPQAFHSRFWVRGQVFPWFVHEGESITEALLLYIIYHQLAPILINCLNISKSIFGSVCNCYFYCASAFLWSNRNCMLRTLFLVVGAQPKPTTGMESGLQL